MNRNVPKMKISFIRSSAGDEVRKARFFLTEKKIIKKI